MFLAPALAVTLLKVFEASDDPGRTSCSSLEYVIQEAAICAARDAGARPFQAQPAVALRPHLCPALVGAGAQLGLSRETLVDIGDWMHSRRSNVPDFWRTVLKRDFCADAREAGWTERPHPIPELLQRDSTGTSRLY